MKLCDECQTPEGNGHLYSCSAYPAWKVEQDKLNEAWHLGKLRDQFAMAALGASIRNYQLSDDDNDPDMTEFEWVARDCYMFADALLEARKK